MIHPYDQMYLPLEMKKTGELFQRAVVAEHINIDEFIEMFISSGMARAFEIANPIYVTGKSVNELMKIILGREPLQVEHPFGATPAYWVGWVLAYAQWNLNRTYKEITDEFPCSRLELYYFPYHEMNVTRSLELIKNEIGYENPLKKHREKLGYTQAQLAQYSGVSIRSIRSYEQGTVELSKASGETLYNLSKVLDCTMEDLIR